MQISFPRKPAPAAPTAVQRARAIIWKCTAVRDREHRHYRLYRYQSAANAANHVNFTMEDELPRPRFRDEEALADSTQYWVRWSSIDIWGNESVLSAAVSETNRKISAAEIDQTPPAAPTITLIGYGDDFDKDTSIDSGLLATVTNPNTGVEIGSYIVEIQRANASGGPWSAWDKTDLPAEDVDDSLTSILRRAANAKKWFRARVRAVAKVSGKKGPWSSYTAAVQPSTATGYAGQAVAKPSVSSVANGYVITASLGALNPGLFREMEIFVDDVSLIRVPNLTYQDMTPRAIDAQPVYKVRLYDRVEGVSNLSPGETAPKFRAAITDELGDKAVTHSKLYGFSFFNITPDFEMSDPRYWTFSEVAGGNWTALPSANAVRSDNPTADGRGNSDYKWRLTSTAVDQSIGVETAPMAVEEGLVYTFSWFIENLMNTPRNLNALVACYRQGASGNLEYTGVTYLQAVRPTSGGASIAGNFAGRRYISQLIPNVVTHVAVKTVVLGVPGEISDIYFATPKMQVLTPAGDVTRWVNVSAAPTGSFGNVARRIAELTVPEYPRRPLFRKAFVGMKNNSGSASAFSIALQSLSPPYTGSWTAVRPPITVNIRDDEYWSTEFFMGAENFEATLGPSGSGISGDEVKYSILATPSQAGNSLNNIELRIETRFA